MNIMVHFAWNVMAQRIIWSKKFCRKISDDHSDAIITSSVITIDEKIPALIERMNVDTEHILGAYGGRAHGGKNPESRSKKMNAFTDEYLKIIDSWVPGINKKKPRSVLGT